MMLPTLKLWLLQMIEDLPNEDNPFLPWYDTCIGMVVCAEDELSAREIAQSNGEDEWISDKVYANARQVWNNSKYTTCVELRPEKEGVIIKNVLEA